MNQPSRGDFLITLSYKSRAKCGAKTPVAISFSQPGNLGTFDPSQTWSYLGVLVASSDAPSGFVGYSGADLFSLNGANYLAVSPVDSNGLYRGCNIFNVSSLDGATVQRASNDVPVLVSSVPDRNDGHLNGACAYDEQATSTILYFERYSAPTSPLTQIFASLITP